VKNSKDIRRGDDAEVESAQSSYGSSYGSDYDYDEDDELYEYRNFLLDRGILIGSDENESAESG